MKQQRDSTRTLYIDIETAPIIGAVWKMWETNVVWRAEDWYILSIAWKWSDEKTTRCLALSDYKGYKAGTTDDSKLLADIWNLLDEAHIVVAHNGDSFDIKKINARLIIKGFKPYSPILQVDTKKIAQGIAGFSSNSLNNIAYDLGLGSKVHTGGKDLWRDCMEGNPTAWRLMKKYNIHDVVLLEAVHLVLRPWAKSHPSIARLDRPACPRCNSLKVQSRGERLMASGRVYNAWACQSCGKWCRTRKLLENKTELI